MQLICIAAAASSLFLQSAVNFHRDYGSAGYWHDALKVKTQTITR